MSGGSVSPLRPIGASVCVSAVARVGYLVLRESALRNVVASLGNVKTVDDGGDGGDWSLVACKRTSKWLLARLGGREDCYDRIHIPP